MSTIASLLVSLGIDARGFHNGVAAVGDKAGSLMGVLSKVAGPAGIAAGALVGVGKMAWEAGQQLDSAMDTIATKTGATGAMLDTLGNDFEAVFTSIPTDAETAASAMAELSSRLNITGGDLQDLSKSLLEVSRLTGGDATKNATDYADAMQKWAVPAEDGTLALDKLFMVSQDTGVGMDKLMGTITQFAAPLQQFGMSFEEAVAVTAKMEQGGFETEKAMAGLTMALGTFAKAGKEPEAALNALVSKIEKAGTESEAVKLAVEKFGAKAGPELAMAIREGAFSVDLLMEKMDGAGGAIMATADATADFPEKLQVLTNKLSTTLAPLGIMLLDAITAAVDAIAPVLDMLLVWLQVNLPPAIAYLSKVWKTVLLPALQTAAGFISEDLIPTLNTITETVNGSLGQALTWLHKSVLAPLAEVFDSISDGIDRAVGWLNKMGDALGDFELPAVLQRHSPSPFEQTLTGIQAGLQAIANTNVPLFAGQFAYAGAAPIADRSSQANRGNEGNRSNQDNRAPAYAITINVSAPGGEPEKVAEATQEGVTRAGRALGLW